MKEETAKPKETNPLILWSLISALALTALFLETRANTRGTSNFFIHGDSDSIGAYVFLDGKAIGRVKSANNSGLSGGTFWCHLDNGTHQLAIRKEGYQTFEKELDFKGQDYLGLNLEK